MYWEAEPRPDLLSGAYLTGHAGVGKTHAACGAIRAYIEAHIVEVEGYQMYRGPRARFVSAPDWLAQLRSTYSSRGKDEREVYQSYANCGLLVLDDLGKGSASEWAAERVYMLLDHRYSHQLPTIITSNYDLGELAERLASDAQTRESIVSRIAGMCKGYKLAGRDRRKKVSKSQ